MNEYSTKHGIYLAIFILITVTAGTWCNKSTSNPYYENLATHRRKFKVAQTVAQQFKPTKYKHKPLHITPIYAITDQLDYLLARKREISKQATHIQGYTIQVYTGGSREEAFKVKNKLYTYYPAILAEITYDVPHYTVRLGEFLDIIEAYPVYVTISKRMPQAIIRPIYFANQPNIFMKKWLVGKVSSAPSMPATDTGHQIEQRD